MLRNTLVLPLTAVALSITLGQRLPAQAKPIAPVEVIATRIPEAPHDVPASIEVLSGEDLRSRGATTLRDALSLSAGVAIAPGGDGGPASAVPEFWGLREFDAFLLVVDGVPWGGALNPAIATLSLHDVERVEVLRGPAPVTYGATSFVGVIHVVHNPAAAKARYAEVHGGSYGSGGAGLEFALPNAGDWNSRVSLDLDRQGFSDPNTSYARGHAMLRTARGQGDKRIWLTADLNILRQDPASPHPRAGAVLSTATPLDASYNPAGAFMNENRIAISAGTQRAIGSAEWGTTASYTFSGQEVFRGFLIDVANSANNAAGVRENIDVNDLYADSHFLWPRGSQWKFVAGTDALFANGEAKGATFTYTAPLTAGSQPSVTEPTNLNLDAGVRRLFLGAFGAAEWHPSRLVTLSGGLRLNNTGERHGESAETAHHTRLSGSLGAIVSLWAQGLNHVNAFADYRDTFKPAAFDFGLGEEADGGEENVLDPETSRSYEGGLKVRGADGRIDVEASVFRMDFENLVTSTTINNQPAFMNTGKTRFQGFELATDLRLPQSVLARATYSFHDGKFVDFVQNFGGVATQLAGKRFEMSARHLASAGFTYAPAHGFVANIGLNYTGDRQLTKRNTALAAAFTTIDAGIGVRLNNLELRVDGRNLGDKRDPISESEFGDSQYYRMNARRAVARVAIRY